MSLLIDTANKEKTNGTQGNYDPRPRNKGHSRI